MKLQEAFQAYDDGKIDFADLQAEQDKAAEDSIRRLEQTGGSSFATYPITDTLAGTGPADNPGVRRGRPARLDRLHRGPAGEQERLAQPLDEQGHAPGVRRPQQPRGLGPLQGGPPTRSC
jgi:hypothetical protein